MKIDAIYVINLASRPDRWAKMQARLTALAGEFPNETPVVRIVGTPAPVDDIPAKVRAVVCSHVECYEDAIAAGAKCVLILEDDAFFTADFAPRMAAALAWMDKNPWNLFHLAFDGQRLEFAAENIARVRSSTYWHAYLVSQAGLVAMRDAALRQLANPAANVWRMLDSVWQNRYGAFEPICIQEPGPSDIRTGTSPDHTKYFFPGSDYHRVFMAKHPELKPAPALKK